MWDKDQPVPVKTGPTCTPQRHSSNQSQGDGGKWGSWGGDGDCKLKGFLVLVLPAPDLTVTPGSTLWLPCVVPSVSGARGPISWTRVHPKKSKLSLLSLTVGEDGTDIEKWVLVTVRGGTVLSLPQASTQQAGTYHCNFGNETIRMQLNVTAQSGGGSPNHGGSGWGY